MANPYSNRPDFAFWSRSVARIAPDNVDPVVSAKFRVSRTDAIATAGSCFAQHIARTLVADGYSYLVTEPGPAEDNYGIFPARFGNIYSTRQFVQLFERAYGLFEPVDVAWTRPDGALVDPFRPQVEARGFSSIQSLEANLESHLGAVRQMFERCNVLIFTLGLTEVWRSTRDGAVFPLAPGVVASPNADNEYEFYNCSVPEMVEDLERVTEMMRAVNANVKIILTVSPVPLIATYENRHVLVSTVYSKSALRVVAEIVVNNVADCAYFPSYEIITGYHTRYGYFAEDLRTVTAAGVENVMRLFREHYLGNSGAEVVDQSTLPPSSHNAKIEEETQALYSVVCDEEALET